MESGINYLYYLLWGIGIYFFIGNLNLIAIYIHELLCAIKHIGGRIKASMISHSMKSFVFHLAVIKVPCVIEDKKGKDKSLFPESNLPFITIIVPVYDEANVIGETIERFMKVDYPSDRYELLIATYESDFTTRTVVNEYMKKYGNIREAINPKKPPTTKAQNVNNAYSHLTERTEIVGLHDAEDRVSVNILKNISSKIKEENCVQSRVVVEINKSSTLTELASAVNFGRYYNFIVPEKARMGYLIFSAGTGTYIKRDILDKVISLDGFLLDDKNLVEDFELSLRLVKHGYKIRYDPISEVREKFPEKFSLAVKQRTRWALGGIQTLKKHGLPRELTFIEKVGILIDFLGLGSPIWLFALSILIISVIGTFAGFKIIPDGSILWYIVIVNTVLGAEEIIMSPYYVMKGDKMEAKKYFRLIPAVIFNDIIGMVAVSKAIFLYVSASQKTFKWEKTHHG